MALEEEQWNGPFPIEWDEDGNPTRYKTIIHEDVEYDGRDVELMRRRTFNLKLDTTITGLKIVLSNGSVLTDTTRDIGSNLSIIQAIDEELVHGTTIEVEYSIEVHNNSSLQCNHLDIITYLPKGFALDKNVRLITSDATNADYGWMTYNMDRLKEAKLITSDAEECTYEKYKGRIPIVSSMDNNNMGINGFYIPPGGSRIIKVGITKVIGSMRELNLDYSLAAEILGYRDNGQNTHRRMATAGITQASLLDDVVTWLHGLFPGNSAEDDYSETSNELYILPPFGAVEEKTPVTYKILIISMISLILLEGFVVIQHQKNKMMKRKKYKKSKST